MYYRITLLFICFSLFVDAQVTNEIEPRSWRNNISNAEISEVNLPSVDVQSYLEEDELAKTQNLAKPFRFGAKIDVNWTLNDFGTVRSLPDGSKIHQMKVVSTGASSLNFMFANYKLAEGAEIYIYSPYGEDKIGPYTSNENNESNRITTWPLEISQAIIEFYEPSDVIGQSSFTIETAVHGYKQLSKSLSIAKVLNESEDCNHDVDCPAGNPYDLQKRSAGMLVVGGNGFCSGSLVNNTEEDRAPLFLTANHCFASGTVATPGAILNVAVRFNWRSPNPSCGTVVPSTNGPSIQTVNALRILMSHGGSDTALTEILSGIPADWDVVFAGWDRSNVRATSAAGIHHPSGDIMKIAIENNPLTSSVINFNGFANSTWVVNDWDVGVTEGGSSGSMLLNQNGLITGVLSGGSAACIGTNDNGGFDFYGRFDVAWIGAGTNTTRLSNHLDPGGTNSTTLDHLVNILSVSEFDADSPIEIYPNPVRESLFINNLKSVSHDYEIYDLTGRLVLNGKSGSDNSISVSTLSQGTYILKLRKSDSSFSVRKFVKQ